MQTSSPAPEAEQLPAIVQAGGQLARKELCRKVSGSTGGQPEHQPAMCPSGKGHPGLH